MFGSIGEKCPGARAQGDDRGGGADDLRADATVGTVK